MLSNTRTVVVLAVALSAAPEAHTFAIGDSQSDTASPHTVFPTVLSNSGTRDGLTDFGIRHPSNGSSSTHRFRRNGEQIGDFEPSDRFATN